MSFPAVGLSLIAALCFVAGGAFMKLSSGFARPGAGALALGLFLGGAIAQTLAMKHGEMGVSYVFILGLEAVLAFAVGAFLFRETVSAPKLLGVALIITGFALLHASKTVGTR
jgi:multidrug transporter EmrE-like cation transporter